MKGKFNNEIAERLYGEWNEGMHSGDCFDGTNWYVLFVDFDGGTGYILTEDGQGFVDVTEYADEAIMAAWHHTSEIADGRYTQWAEHGV